MKSRCMGSIIAEKKRRYMANVKQWVLDRIADPKPIEKEEYMDWKMNSYEQKLLRSIYSDELFIERMRYYISQSSGEFDRLGKFEIASTYNDAIKGELLHELIERFEKQLVRTKELNEAVKSCLESQKNVFELAETMRENFICPRCGFLDE